MSYKTEEGGWGARLDAFIVVQRAPDELAADVDLQVLLIDDCEQDLEELDDPPTNIETRILKHITCQKVEKPGAKEMGLTVMRELILGRYLMARAGRPMTYFPTSSMAVSRTAGEASTIRFWMLALTFSCFREKASAKPRRPLPPEPPKLTSRKSSGSSATKRLIPRKLFVLNDTADDSDAATTRARSAWYSPTRGWDRERWMLSKSIRGCSSSVLEVESSISCRPPQSPGRICSPRPENVVRSCRVPEVLREDREPVGERLGLLALVIMFQIGWRVLLEVVRGGLGELDQVAAEKRPHELGGTLLAKRVSEESTGHGRKERTYFARSLLGLFQVREDLLLSCEDRLKRGDVLVGEDLSKKARSENNVRERGPVRTTSERVLRATFFVLSVRS